MRTAEVRRMMRQNPSAAMALRVRHHVGV